MTRSLLVLALRLALDLEAERERRRVLADTGSSPRDPLYEIANQNGITHFECHLVLQ